MASCSQQEREAKFAFLFNPIKDLAKNFNVDVTGLLEEYLAELEMLTISFDGGQTTMNFAEAALIIQGSACVYSKKVDCLYHLVLDMLEFIRNQKKRQKGPDKANAGVEDSSEQDDFDDFRSVELTIATNIDLKKEECTLEFLPIVPYEFIPLNENERGLQLIYDSKDRLLGHKLDFACHSLYLDNSGTLRLPFPVCSNDMDDLWEDFQELEMDPFPAVWNTSQLVANRTVLEADDGGGSDPEDNGCVAEMSDAPEVENNEVVPPAPVKGSNGNKGGPNIQTPKLWQPLNPHEPSNEKEKPPRRGKTLNILVPEKTPKRSKRKKQKCEKDSRTSLTGIAVFCKQAFFSHSPKLLKQDFNPMLSLEDARHKELERRKPLLKDIFSKKGETPDCRIYDSDADSIIDDPGDGGDFYDEPDGGTDVEDGIIRRPATDGPDEQVSNTEDPSFTHLLLKHLANQRAEANARFKLSDSAVKVREWQDNMSNLLDAEELKPHFDIDAYCGQIMGVFKEKSTITFAEVVRENSWTEVSRYFLATLQLANTYNLEIQAEQGVVLHEDQLKLSRLEKQSTEKRVIGGQ